MTIFDELTFEYAVAGKIMPWVNYPKVIDYLPLMAQGRDVNRRINLHWS